MSNRKDGLIGITGTGVMTVGMRIGNDPMPAVRMRLHNPGGKEGSASTSRILLY